MTNLTSQQQTAVDFFSLYEDQVKYFGLTIFEEREERRLYNQGKKLQVELTRSATSIRNEWKREEVKQLIDLYVKNDNLHWVRDTFMSNNSSQPHSKDSVYQTVAQLCTLDKNRVEDTQWKVTTLTEELALEMYPNRFGSVSEMKKLSLEAQAEKILSDLLG